MKLPTRLLISILCLFASTQVLAEPQKVLMKTSMGEITIALDNDKAPKSVANFLAYVDAGFYDDTIFHRVIPGFMIQGGGLGTDMEKKPTSDPVENEAKNGLQNVRGSIAMARTNDPHSATAQFFINLKDNDFLNYPGRDGWGYTVFGKVTDGMGVVDAIAAVSTGTVSGRRDVPRETVLIESVSRLP
jgi:cyclophilin family peptidyl-prolyl cis-trans isomerase